MITVAGQSTGDSDNKDITSDSAETVLEALERSNVVIQYHCRDGFCGACRSKLIHGQVEYTTDPLAFIDDDEFLPCCTKPTTNITIGIT